MTKLLIAGDCHSGYWIRKVLQVADRRNVESAIVVGDCWDAAMDYSDCKAKPYLVQGNHEKAHEWDIGLAQGRCIPEYSLFTLHGVKFGVIGKIDEVNHAHLQTSIPWLYDALGPKPDIWMEKRPVDEVVAMFKGIDVLLTHDTPYPITFKDPEGNKQTSGSLYLREIVDKLQPKLAISGHYHHYHKRKMGETTAITLDKQGVKSVPLSIIELDSETLEYTHVPLGATVDDPDMYRDYPLFEATQKAKDEAAAKSLPSEPGWGNRA